MYKKMVFDAFGTYTNETVLESGSPDQHLHTSLPPFLVFFAEDDMPGFPLEALNFVESIREVFPDDPSRVALEFVSREDISEKSWNAASEMASQQQAIAKCVGHYAEVATINQKEYSNRITKAIASFINAH